MQAEKVINRRWWVISWALLACTLALSGLSGCSPEKSPPGSGRNTTTAASIPDDSDLLLRVRFAGTTALLSHTNATYLTNLAALPETAALGERLVERMATLPGRLLTRGSTRAVLSTNLASIFNNLLHQGFALELRGDSNGVYSMMLAASNTAMVPGQLQAALGSNVTDRSSIQSANGWTTWVVDTRTNQQPSTINHQLIPPTVLAVDLASAILPGPIQRSAYGGFQEFSFTAIPTDRGFKIRGVATYSQDLPELKDPVVIPIQAVTEPVNSFSMVRNLTSWLPPESALLHYFPRPTPSSIWFWGGDSSPYQFYAAVPFEGTNRFVNEFVPAFVDRLEKLSAATDCGPVEFDADQYSISWSAVPFIAPKLTLISSQGHGFLLAESFLTANMAEGLPKTLTERVAAATNSVAFDWEFTAARIDSWFRVGQLALLVAGQQQLGPETPSTKWLVATSKVLPSGGNMFTEISQRGPRELALDRLAPLGFSSVELFWLANWLESEKFPDADFLVPVPPAAVSEEPAK